MPNPNPARALRAIREGHHAHDQADLPALHPDTPPQKGMNVALHLDLVQPLECTHLPGEVSNWLAMVGHVTRVVDADHVVATAVSSTRRAPLDFDGRWTAELRRQPGADHPWVLTALTPEVKMRSTPGALDESTGSLTFKIVCLGKHERVQAALADIATSVGRREPPGNIDFLPLMMGNPGDSEITVWMCTVPAGAQQLPPLLLHGADGLLLIADGAMSPLDAQRVRDAAAQLTAQGRTLSNLESAVHLPKYAPDDPTVQRCRVQLGLPPSARMVTNFSAFEPVKQLLKALLERWQKEEEAAAAAKEMKKKKKQQQEEEEKKKEKKKKPWWKFWG